MNVSGISAEKIAIATQQKDLPYIITDEIHKEEVMESRKRKLEEEEKEMQRKKQRKEMIVMKDGKIISTGMKEKELDQPAEQPKTEEAQHNSNSGMSAAGDHERSGKFDTEARHPNNRTEHSDKTARNGKK